MEFPLTKVSEPAWSSVKRGTLFEGMLSLKSLLYKQVDLWGHSSRDMLLEFKREGQGRYRNSELSTSGWCFKKLSWKRQTQM
jgi:hypothetical protein